MLVERPLFDGGRSLLRGSVAAGVVGLLLTGVRGLGDARLALHAYLVAFAFWLSLGLGALVLLMAFHAARARWMIVVRRPLEAFAGALVVFPLLFAPIILGVRLLFPWAGPKTGLDEETLRVLHHRALYLNSTFFAVRSVLYFAVWVTLATAFWRWSTRQDASRATDLTVKAWKLGAGGLPALGLTLTFASFDWLMSLDAHWYSTIWGVYFFAGGFVSAIAILILAALALERTPSLSGAIRPAHWLSLGKLLLAFTVFWAYIAFSQYMLTWVGNLPEAIPWLLRRQSHGWAWVSGALLVGHFALPFLLLLSRQRKLEPHRLARVAAWLVAIHYLDIYWLVMPQIRPESPMPDWCHFTALVGVGGVATAAVLWRLRGRYALPVGDPFLAESLAYSRMQ